MTNIKKILAKISLVLLWLFVLLFLTLLSREPGVQASYCLEPFWCIREAWEYESAIDWYFIIGNIVLFLPLGIILPLCFVKMRHTAWNALIGFLVSLGIETTQLITHRGLFETDDLIHNTLGTVLGYGIFIVLYQMIREVKLGSKLERIVLLALWGITIVFLAYAAIMGQPLMDWALAYLKYTMKLS